MTVKTDLTPPDAPNPRQQRVENDGYAAMLSRVPRAYARRVGDSDPEDLATMLALRDEFDLAIATAVTEMRRRYGFSWADIGRAAGTTKQAAHERRGTTATEGSDR